MADVDDLLNYIFEDKKTAFYPEFENWVRASRRFKAFATDYRNKIRTKVKNTRDEDSMHDLRAELETAALLLHEKQFTLEYEKYASAKQRGPDYTAVFKTRTPFNVEVRRIRKVELNGGDADIHMDKLMAVLCDKVGQMPPSVINLLWLSAGFVITEADLTRAVTTLRQRADGKDEAFFTKRGFKNATDFIRKYRQLSGIILHQGGANAVWLNALTKHKAPPDLVTAIRRLATI